MTRSLWALLALWAALGACAPSPFEDVGDPVILPAYPNPFGPDAPQYAPQPHREKPTFVLTSADGATAWVSLPGTPDAPGHDVVMVDLASGRTQRIAVGTSPRGMALHPAGRVLVVATRFEDRLAVVDVARAKVTHHPRADFYADDVAFSPDGGELWIANRWRDAVAVWDVEADGGGLRILARDEPGVPVGMNPRQLVISPDGATVAVASVTELSVSLIDRVTRRERRRVMLGAPANGLAFVGDGWLVVATLSASTHHPADRGPDGDGDGLPGDGTPNVNFQDLQNELAVVRVETGEIVHRYTSDTICCRDYRDVQPEDEARLGGLLPPRDTWIVGGALPEQVAADGQRVWVSYSGSNELQPFTLDPATGALTPGAVVASAGHQPVGLAVAAGRLLVANRLSETLGVHDAGSGALLTTLPVGDLGGGAFPATDAEIGALFNFVTAPFNVDGDQSCSHCHREEGNLDKALSMPLTRYAGLGLRMTMAYRGQADTRPWFMESAMDETNFKPVTNEMARIENFCCSDYTLWPNGPPRDCETNLPPECEQGRPGSADGFTPSRAPGLFRGPWPTPYGTRDAFFLAVSEKMLGRTRSFGDGLFFEDPVTEEKRSIRLDFDGMTRALGLFLLTAPRLLPNPNSADTAAAKRGKALFESPETGCSTCHPAPTFAASTDVNPFGVPLRMGPVVTPFRDAEGRNLDLLSTGFVDTFPQAEVDLCDDVCGEEACALAPDGCDGLRETYFGVPSLRGIWDRAPHFLHDGRARGLREVLCTPGHPALHEGEVGRNERDGVIDTHGGTSHLAPDDIEDLITYILTL